MTKVLILYPNLPLMMSPPLSVALFTRICKDAGVEVKLFETTHYADTEYNAQTNKEKFGAGRIIKDYQDAFEEVKPTSQAIPDLIKLVDDYVPDLVLLSIVEDTFFDGIEMLEAIKDKNIPHVVGGVFPINAPHECLKPDVVDCIARYEGEYVVRDVVDRVKSKQPFKDVKGLWWSDGTKNEPQPLVNVNEYLPDYSLFSPKRFYRPIGGQARKTVQLETYRGCPYSCTFCNSPTTRLMDRNYLRRKTLDTVRKEMYNLCESLDTEYWFVIDDAFTARPRKELFGLLDIFKEVGLPWWCNTRLDDVDEEILSAMKESHCDRIQFGVESGNEGYRMDVLKRKVKQEVYLNKADIINNCGIPYGLNAIIGMPNETREMVLETAKLCKDIGGYDGLGVSIFIPYWGTGLRDVAVSEGYLSYDHIGSGGLQDEPLLDMPAPYLSKKQTMELSKKFKYYCFFDEKYWDMIDRSDDLGWLEKIYQQEFFQSNLAVDGLTKIKERKRSPYACAADPYVEF